MPTKLVNHAQPTPTRTAYFETSSNEREREMNQNGQCAQGRGGFRGPYWACPMYGGLIGLAP
eukprot:2297519-Amphidinium_carterae.1